jgi:hypothetical protein
VPVPVPEKIDNQRRFDKYRHFRARARARARVLGKLFMGMEDNLSLADKVIQVVLQFPLS